MVVLCSLLCALCCVFLPSARSSCSRQPCTWAALSVVQCLRSNFRSLSRPHVPCRPLPLLLLQLRLQRVGALLGPPPVRGQGQPDLPSPWQLQPPPISQLGALEHAQKRGEQAFLRRHMRLTHHRLQISLFLTSLILLLPFRVHRSRRRCCRGCCCRWWHRCCCRRRCRCRGLELGMLRGKGRRSMSPADVCLQGMLGQESHAWAELSECARLEHGSCLLLLQTPQQVATAAASATAAAAG